MVEGIDSNSLFEILAVLIVLLVIFWLLFGRRGRIVGGRHYEHHRQKVHRAHKDWRKDWHVTGAPFDVRKQLKEKPGSMVRRGFYVYQQSGKRILRTRI